MPALAEATILHIANSKHRGGGTTVTGDSLDMPDVEAKLDRIVDAQAALVAAQSQLRIDVVDQVHSVQLTLTQQAAEAKATTRDVADLRLQVTAMAVRIGQLERVKWVATGVALAAGGIGAKVFTAISG